MDIHVYLHNVTDPALLAAIADLKTTITQQGATMTDALSNLETAEATVDTDVTALEGEQTTFLADIQSALASGNAAAIQAVADKLNAEAARIAAMQSAEVAADPATPAAPASDIPAA